MSTRDRVQQALNGLRRVIEESRADDERAARLCDLNPHDASAAAENRRKVLRRGDIAAAVELLRQSFRAQDIESRNDAMKFLVDAFVAALNAMQPKSTPIKWSVLQDRHAAEVFSRYYVAGVIGDDASPVLVEMWPLERDIAVKIRTIGRADEGPDKGNKAVTVRFKDEPSMAAAADKAVHFGELVVVIVLSAGAPTSEGVRSRTETRAYRTVKDAAAWLGDKSAIDVSNHHYEIVSLHTVNTRGIAVHLPGQQRGPVAEVYWLFADTAGTKSGVLRAKNGVHLTGRMSDAETKVIDHALLGD